MRNKHPVLRISLVIATMVFLLWSFSIVIMCTCKNYKPLKDADARALRSKILESLKSIGTSGMLSEKRCFFHPWNNFQTNVSLGKALTRDKSRLLYPNGMPKIVHTTWKTDSLTESWKEDEEQCRFLNRDFTFCHWTDEDLLLFVASEYPEMLDKFVRYPYPIQRADVGRYLLLHRIGGFYRDVNVGCKTSFDDLYRNESLRHSEGLQLSDTSSSFKVLLVSGSPMGVAGDFMASIPGHRLFRRFVESLKSRPFRYGLPYLDVMLGTGPLFLSSVYHSFLQDSTVDDREKDEVRVMPDDSRIVDYFRFSEGGTWHCLDGMLLWFLFEHCVAIVFAAFGLVCAFVLYSRFALVKRAWVRANRTNSP